MSFSIKLIIKYNYFLLEKYLIMLIIPWILYDTFNHNFTMIHRICGILNLDFTVIKQSIQYT